MTAKVQPQPPAEAELAPLLGDAWPARTALLENARDLRPEWKYYGTKYGWSLKLFQGSRNLCFLGHYGGELRVGFVFGERDVPRVMAAAVPQPLKDEFAAARQYVEGRGLSVRVHALADLPPVLQLLDIKRTPLPAAKARRQRKE